MNIFEMQADLARSWMQLAEAGSKALSEACLNGTQQSVATWQGAAEAVAPKPQPQLPQPFAMFGAAPPALAPNPLLSMMFPAAQPAWPFAAMFGMHVGVGDESICPGMTYWASALPCFSLDGDTQGC